MLTLIIGRTCSGKTTYASMLKEHGLKPVVSRTTRPRRTPDENDYVFLTKDEAAAYDNRLTETVINNHQYFVIPDDLKDKDYYIIDPIGAYALTKAMPDETFIIVYIQSNQSFRKERFVRRMMSDSGVTKKEAEIAFHERNVSEAKQFDDFEKAINEADNMLDVGFPYNVGEIQIYPDMNDTTHMNENVHTLITTLNRTRVITRYMQYLIDNNIMSVSNDGRIAVTLTNSDKTIWSTPEQFAVTTCHQDAYFNHFITEIIDETPLLNTTNRIPYKKQQQCAHMSSSEFSELLTHITDECLAIDDAIANPDIVNTLSQYLHVTITNIHRDANDDQIWICY